MYMVRVVGVSVNFDTFVCTGKCPAERAIDNAISMGNEIDCEKAIV